MPLPLPTDAESKAEFIERFMSDAKMIEEFPEEDQRRAVAETQWESTDRYEASRWMLASGQVKAVEGEQWIKVFPNGTYWISKYGKDVVFDSKFFREIAEAFDAASLSKPKIDKDHKFETSFGDILGYDVRPDGMYFKIALNAKGLELVKNKEYSYISPAWGKTTATDKKTFLNRLLAISLVNFPALEGALPALQEQLALSKYDFVEPKTKKEVPTMELYALSAELNLNKDADAESILLAVKALKADVAKANEEKKAAEDTAISLGKELQTIKQETLKKEAVDVITESIKLGKIVPATQDIWINRFMLDKEATVNELSLIPEQTYSGKKTGGAGDGTVDAETEKLMLKAGLDPKNAEDIKIFTATRKGGK